MKICDFRSTEFKNAVKMCLIAGLVLTYFIYAGIHCFSDVVFPVVFIILIFRFFTV